MFTYVHQVTSQKSWLASIHNPEVQPRVRLVRTQFEVMQLGIFEALEKKLLNHLKSLHPDRIFIGHRQYLKLAASRSVYYSKA